MHRPPPSRFFPAGTLSSTGTVLPLRQRVDHELLLLALEDPSLFEKGSGRRLRARLRAHRASARSEAGGARTPYPRSLLLVPALLMAFAAFVRTSGALSTGQATGAGLVLTCTAAAGLAVLAWFAGAARSLRGPAQWWEPLPLWLTLAGALGWWEVVWSYQPVRVPLAVWFGMNLVWLLGASRLPAPLTARAWHEPRVWCAELRDEALTWTLVTLRAVTGRWPTSVRSSGSRATRH